MIGTRPPMRLACLISGGGRTVMNLADRIDDGSLNASIELVIASRAKIAGVERCRSRGLRVEVVARKDFSIEAAMHDRISELLRDHRIDLVCLCGYLRWFRVDAEFKGKVINIHPALLPDFGGPGMHGDHVHAAVLAAKKTVSGCTVHYVDEQYDHGRVILQRSCEVLADDTIETLAARVFEQECIAYPEAIRVLAHSEQR